MLKMYYVWAASLNDYKRSKLTEKDSIFSQNTPIREGRNLLLRMCTLNAVMTRKPLFYG